MSAPKRRDDAEDWREVPQLRNLRRLVSALTAVLMIGVLAVAVTLVIRIASEPGARAIAKVTAEEVSIPADAKVIAVGATASSLTVAIRDGEGGEAVLVFHPETGALISRTAINRD